MENATIHPVINRILDIADDLGYSTRKFELSIGKSNGYINGMKNRGGSPTIDVLSDIVETYPQYDLMWLVTGKGAMKKQPTSAVAEPNADYLKDISTEAFEKVFKEFVAKIVKKEVDPRFERMAENIQILMGRAFTAEEAKEQRSKTS